MSVIDNIWPSIDDAILDEGGGECMHSHGDWRARDKQAQDTLEGKDFPKIGARPEDEGDVMVPNQVFKQPVDVRS